MLAFALVVFVGPGIWVGLRAFEDALVGDATKTLRQVQSSWTAQLDDLVVSAQTSALRLGRMVSLLPEPNVADAAEFDRLVVRDPDGCWRSRAETFNADREAGIWIPPRVQVDDRTKGFYVAAKRLLEAYYTGAKGELEDAYVMPEGGGDVEIWPGHADYIRGLPPETSFDETDWMAPVRPDRDPDGLPRWTPTMYDPSARMWMLSAVAPYRRNGKFAGSVAQDLLVTKLLARLGDLSLYEGMHHYLVRADGTLLVSDAHLAEIERSGGTMKLDAIGDPDLARVFAAATSSVRERGTTLVDGGPKSQRIFVATYLPSPDWYLLSETPRTVILKDVRASYRTAWYAVTAAILGVLVLLLAVTTRVALPPVRRLLSSAERVSRGELEHQFQAGGAREFERIAEALNIMMARLRRASEESEEARVALAASEAEARGLLEARTKDEQELRSKLALIERQQATIRLLQTPLIQVWDDVLALPIVGVLDDARAAALTDDLLQSIVRAQARVVILDLTGAEVREVSTAEHLMRILRAVGLLGARGVVTGIRSDTARVMVSLGVDQSGLTTLGSLREAIHWCMRQDKNRSLT